MSPPTRITGRVVGALVVLGAAAWLGWIAVPSAEQPVVTDRDAGDGAVVAEGADSSSVRLPVLLVPGWFDTERDLAALRIRLIGAGWSPSSVEAITFDDPTGSNRAHAGEVEGAVRALLDRTGAERLDVVAHSMGGLATRWYLMTSPDAPIRRVAFLASPHRGTLSAHLAWGEGRSEMMPDSPFLDSLNARAPTPSGAEAITIRTSVDTHIVPGESATLPGVRDYLLCCPTHAGLLRDEEAFEIVLGFLRSGTNASAGPDSADTGRP